MDSARIIAIIKALAVGAVGGFIADFLAIPLAWMIGPMIANIIASMGGVKVAIPTQMRASMLIVLGCFLGSTFSPDMLDQIFDWPVSLISVLLFVVFITFISTVYYQRAAKFDFITALFSATPGGLTPMTILGSALGGKEQYIAFTQGLRVVIIVCFTPVLIFGVLGQSQDAGVAISGGNEINWLENAILLGSAIVGVFVAGKLKIPAAQMTGAMFVSAALFLSGTITAELPHILLEVTLWILGSAIGSRFAGFDMKIIKRLSLLSIINIICLLAITTAIAYFLSQTLGLEFIALLLAFAPGGVAEMCLIALALNIDPGFVAFHHLARISLILLVTPMLGRMLSKDKKLS